MLQVQQCIFNSIEKPLQLKQYTYNSISNAIRPTTSTMQG